MADYHAILGLSALVQGYLKVSVSAYGKVRVNSLQHFLDEPAVPFYFSILPMGFRTGDMCFDAVLLTKL